MEKPAVPGGVEEVLGKETEEVEHEMENGIKSDFTQGKLAEPEGVEVGLEVEKVKEKPEDEKAEIE